MLKLPPPIWMFLFLAIAYGLGIAFPKMEIADLSVVPLGVALTIAGVILGASSVGLFRIERTEINPVSAENKNSSHVGHTDSRATRCISRWYCSVWE